MLFGAVQRIFKDVLIMRMTEDFTVLLFQLKSELGIDVFPDFNCQIDD